MKILNIMTSTMKYDGITMSNLNYLRNINTNKYLIDYIAPNVVKKEIKKEVELYGGQIFELVYKNKKMKQVKPFTYYRKIKQIIEKESYDIVHVHGNSATLCLEMIAAKKAGCKIRIAHSRNTKTDHKILDKILRPIFYKTYTHGFACGEDAGKWLFGNRKFDIINNGKRLDDFKFNNEIRIEMRKKLNLEDKIIFGHVGNFNYQKNHEFLIKIFYEFLKEKNDKNKYRLILIGHGGLQDNIQTFVKNSKLEDNVIFVGSTSEVSKWLQIMDIMIFPSRFEGFPNVLVEWQIAGLPCLISDKITKDVKLTDLVEFESIDKSPKVWAERIENITLRDREKEQDKILKEIRERGFDIKENAKKLEEIYQKLVEESK